MSWWDIFIVIMLALAIFRGYQTGLGKRLSGWVGLVIGAGCVLAKLDAITARLEPMVDGKAKAREWLVDYFNARGAASATGPDEFINTWLDRLQLPDMFADQIRTQFEHAADDIYETVYGEIASILATPLWNLMVFLCATIVVTAIFIIAGLLLHKLMSRVHVLDTVSYTHLTLPTTSRV